MSGRPGDARRRARLRCRVRARGSSCPQAPIGARRALRSSGHHVVPEEAADCLREQLHVHGREHARAVARRREIAPHSAPLAAHTTRLDRPGPAASQAGSEASLRRGKWSAWRRAGGGYATSSSATTNSSSPAYAASVGSYLPLQQWRRLGQCEKVAQQPQIPASPGADTAPYEITATPRIICVSGHPAPSALDRRSPFRRLIESCRNMTTADVRLEPG